MLPSFAAMAMLGYEWYQHQSEIRFLIYALVCLIIGVFFGSLIINTSTSADGQMRESDTPIMMDNELLPGMEPPAPKGTPAENWTGGVVQQEAWWENTSPAFMESDASQSEATPDGVGADGVVVKTDSPEAVPAAATPAVPAAAVSSAPVAEKSLANEQSEKEAEELALAREFLAPTSEKPSVASDSSAVSSMFQSFDATPDSSKQKVSDEEITAKILSEHKSKPEPVGEDKVEKAQQVVARLEAEVAKAEAVAKKLEDELAKAEPMAARLETNEPAKEQKPQIKDNTKKTTASQSNKAISSASQSNKAAKFTGQNKKADPIKSAEEIKSIDDAMAKAALAEAAGTLDEAIKLYDAVTKLDLKHFDAWYKKGLVTRKKGKHDDALYCFNYALRINEKSSEAWTEKGECLLLGKKNDQALIAFDKALIHNKQSPTAWLGKARCFVAMNKHKDAVACFDKVIALEPENQTAKDEKQTAAAKVSAKK